MTGAAAAPPAGSGPAAGGSVAVVAVHGRQVRYAEVAPGARLQRLGTVDVEADVEAALFGPGDDAALRALARALREVFAGDPPALFLAVAPPAASTAFFTPLPAGLAADAREAHLRQEAALLADLSPSTPVRVRASVVRTTADPEAPGGVREWFHVLHLPEAVHARLAALAGALGAARYDVADRARAAAAAAPAAEGVEVVVGLDGPRAEAAVLVGGAFVLAHEAAAETPEDVAYAVLAALRAAGAEGAPVARLRAWGDAAGRLDLLASLAGVPAEPLDAFAAVGRRPPGLDPWEAAAFAPVVGAALCAS